MDNEIRSLIEKLEFTHELKVEEYETLVSAYSEETASVLAEAAVRQRKQIYGNTVFVRGLIEISNICKNDCYYCGIRNSNRQCERYRLTIEDVLKCCEEGYTLGFRTFVLQGGEDGYFTDNVLVELVGTIRERYPACAITLSLGERSRESYMRLYAAGANRYLLRHETATPEHYAQLHPNTLSLERRMECLQDLKELGYQVGCGFMVGAPYQTSEHLAKDLKFIENFQPDMCGIGPFIPHVATPFADWPAGTAELTCYLLSIIRLISPEILLPATTALGTIMKEGRERGILSGANVIMPNLSPVDVRNKYELYNNKLHSGAESAQALELLKRQMAAIGYEIVVDRGDRRYKT